MSARLGAVPGSLDRRGFLKSSGALVMSFSLPGMLPGSADAAGFGPAVPQNAVDSWLAIGSDGTVTLFCGKVELGTGINTAFSQIVAEELDVALSSVRIVQGDTARTPDQGVTSASRSIAAGGPQIRQAAAEARLALLELASAQLGTAPAQLTVTEGVVTNGTSRVAYRELVGGKRFERTVTGKAVVKKPADYRIVGRSAPRVDIPEKLTARFTYVQDVRVPGMVHARVIRPAAVGAKLVRVAGFAKGKSTRPGVRIVTRKDFVAVVAPTEREAIRAAADLKIEWSGGGGLPPQPALAAALRVMPSTDVTLMNNGSLDRGFQRTSRRLSSTYSWPFHSHASIGPSCAVADVRGDGTVTVWSATQDVHMQREAVARLLGTPKENVRIIYVEGSGCYGHNGSDDANGDAALISKEIGQPVRVQWMRHDEFGWAPRGAPYLVDMKGGIGERGEITAWDFEAWVLTHSARYRTYGNKVSGYLLATRLSGGEVDVPIIAEAGRILNTGAIAGIRPLYDLPDSRILIHALQTAEPHPLRPSEMRSVAGLGALFASESFFDELAAAAGRDPLQFRIDRLKDSRAIDVLNAVAKLSNWQPRTSPNPARGREGVLRGRGVAMYAFGTYAAIVAEVEVNPASGQIRVTKINVAHDCGLIVNPDGLRNQIEGNAVQGTSRTLLEEVKWDDKRVTSLDWLSYPILRFPDVPEVAIELINRPDVPATGAGEATTYPIAAAIGNAVFDATGVRLRQGPLTAERMKAALQASRA